VEEKISEEMAMKLVRVLNEHTLSEKEMQQVINICIRVWREKGLIKE
jgi:hypothetical protein